MLLAGSFSFRAVGCCGGEGAGRCGGGKVEIWTGEKVSHLVESCHRLIRAANLNLVKESLRAITAFTRTLCYFHYYYYCYHYYIYMIFCNPQFPSSNTIVLFGRKIKGKKKDSKSSHHQSCQHSPRHLCHPSHPRPPSSSSPYAHNTAVRWRIDTDKSCIRVYFVRGETRPFPGLD